MQCVQPNRRKRGSPKESWKDGMSKAMSACDLSEGQPNNRNSWMLGIRNFLRDFKNRSRIYIKKMCSYYTLCSKKKRYFG